tara:strand:+ start:790 stop:1038 length:249 start_codon:yes stop_codon:yes gene_type:complete
MKENKLIGDFMDIRNTGLSIYKESEYKYHDSWDWLMPVLKKIKLQIHPNNMGMWRKVTQPIGYDIHEVHQEAVEFIKRYSNE